MKIIEHYICGKNPDQSLCEDGLFISDRVAAVIDGVTSKGGHLWNGRKSGAAAKDLALEILGKWKPDSSAESFFNAVNDAFAEADRRENVAEDPKERLRACIILYNEACHEIWSYGDCQCLINNKLYRKEKRIDILNSEERAYRLEYLLANGHREEEFKIKDPGREYIREGLEMQFSFENKDSVFGYPVLNGDSINPGQLVRLPVKCGDSIVLASDGYPKLHQTLADSEHSLAGLLQEDPLCFRKNRSAKGLAEGNLSFDDRCYCKIVTE